MFGYIYVNVGKNSFVWLGPIPRVFIMDPEQLKAALSLYNDFQKPTINPLVKLLFDGLINHEGEKWVKHRKIVNHAFHFEKLKVYIFPSISFNRIFNFKIHIVVELRLF